jgi:hypothetical protein
MIAASWRDWVMVFQITKNTTKSASYGKWRPAALGPACVKTQKRPHLVPSKLDRVSDEVGLNGKGVISLEALQILDSPQLILTSTITFF